MGTYGDADLVVTAGVTYTRTFQYKNLTVPIDWSLYTIKSEVRDRLGTILLNLAPFMVVNTLDHTTLVLTIAAATTYLVPQDAKWDMLATLITDPTVNFRTPIPSGRVLLIPGVTHG